MGGIGTNTTSSHIWLFYRDSPLLVEEKFSLLGFAQDLQLTGLTQSQLQDLSGEAMSLVSIGMVLLSCLSTFAAIA